MGIPAGSPPQSDTNIQSNVDGPAAAARPSSVSELPPAALDLAAKLFDLARNGDTATLTAYIDAGIPKNLTNHDGNTLIMLAAYNDQAETVRMLLSKGSDPNVLNGRGQSPIAGACFKGYADVVRALVEGGADIMAGQPTAPDTAKMFKRPDLLEIMGVKEDEVTGRSIVEALNAQQQQEQQPPAAS